ncbi:hypothetical protein Aargi30884_27530 [Amedibacterium intestinale]|jgi:hypothetical protein|uniref:Uncharacterized protein n=1 Tax=Amedibacterium intestinale TaxID=2583452 RepID=A0A6N4TLB5_9FIRM|nr:lactate permease [Amedibacterium intestinale]BBK23850.1 hypothetical protein Aargi30884_27530 [Amedibacterium intestinale]DAQ11621.1 MAG TPA: CUE domain protein [Caudoviricetes sp.]
MKLTQLANFYLKYMVKEYSENHQKTFSDWNKLRSMFPNEDEEFICDAFRKLSKDGLVKNSWADNHPYLITLEINAIIEAEENTLLKKTYDFLKEVREWL